MEVFLGQRDIVLNDIPEGILAQISNLSHLSADEEICGIIYDGCKNFIQCKNISNNKSNSFCIDPYVFIEYDVNIVFHSHVIGSSSPSCWDMDSSNKINIPYLIYSLRDKDFYLYNNVGV